MTEPMFLEPPGLVVPKSALACAKARQFAEYLRERADPYSPELEKHYEPVGNRLRYGQGCRDVSVILPADRAALHGAIAASEIRSLTSEASITIWRVGERSSVQRFDVQPSPIHRLELGGWTVAYDEALVDALVESRARKLPNETGGVLVGAHDLEQKTVHLVVRVSSPSDSAEWPTLYVRGVRDLSRTLKLHARSTDGMLGYVGEWHSHPPGCGSAPSPLDRQAVEKVAGEMNPDGLPALVVILGEDDLTVLLRHGPETAEGKWDLSHRCRETAASRAN